MAQWYLSPLLWFCSGFSPCKLCWTRKTNGGIDPFNDYKPSWRKNISQIERSSAFKLVRGSYFGHWTGPPLLVGVSPVITIRFKQGCTQASWLGLSCLPPAEYQPPRKFYLMWPERYFSKQLVFASIFRTPGDAKLYQPRVIYPRQFPLRNYYGWRDGYVGCTKTVFLHSIALLHGFILATPDGYFTSSLNQYLDQNVNLLTQEMGS